MHLSMCGYIPIGMMTLVLCAVLCVCIYMCIYVCVDFYAFEYMWIYTNWNDDIDALCCCVCVYMCIYVCVDFCAFEYMWIYTHWNDDIVALCCCVCVCVYMCICADFYAFEYMWIHTSEDTSALCCCVCVCVWMYMQLNICEYVQMITLVRCAVVVLVRTCACVRVDFTCMLIYLLEYKCTNELCCCNTGVRMRSCDFSSYT